MLIKAKVNFRDLQHGEVIRPVGQVMEVSEDRGNDLIAKGLAEPVHVLVIEDPVKELTVAELKEALAAKNIEYDAKAKKAELQELLEGAE